LIGPSTVAFLFGSGLKALATSWEIQTGGFR
jgi:hypothetical protein